MYFIWNSSAKTNERLMNMSVMLKRRIASYSWSIVRGVLLIGLCFLIINPVFIKLSTTIMTEKDIFDPTVQWVPTI